MQVIRVGVRRLFDDARDDDRREILAQRDQLVDRRDVRGDQIAQLRRRLVERERTPRNHSYETFIRAICSRNRTSES